MVYTVAIIGSFQKYYDEILKVIKLFKSSGLYVLSPKESYICDRIDDFVLFESDSKCFSPEEIQMITLEKIINADVVYVYNPEGYVGRTTCYEIGFCFSKRKPLFFFDYPLDLPIPILREEQVMKPELFVSYAVTNEAKFITDYDLCDDGQRAFNNLFDLNKINTPNHLNRIVICGSMLFFKEMVICQQQLESLGIEAIIPKEEDNTVSFYNEKQYLEFKKKVSRTYLKKIRDKDTAGVLIYNAPKRGIANYIGANTLVELAMAFTWNRKIFLLNDIYDPLKDELNAWNCICIHGNLQQIKDELEKEEKSLEPPMQSQLSLFQN